MAVEAPTVVERCEILLEPDQRVTQGIKIEDNGDVVFVAIAVDKNKKPNRRGFVFDWDRPEDVHVEAWLKNPVLIYRHEDDLIPVGWIEDVQITGKRVKCTCRIPNLAEDADMAEYDRQVIGPVRGAVRTGLLKAVSIGFYIIRKEEIEKGEDTFIGEVGGVYRVKEFEIVELSVCSIGAHESALIQQTFDQCEDARSAFQAHAQQGRWVQEQNDKRVLHRLSLDEDSEATGHTQDASGEESESPATDNSESSAVPESEAAAESFDCECIKCGHKLTSTKHCKDLKCPKCGGQMRRAERPGPGQDVAPPKDELATWRGIPYARHGDSAKADEDAAWDAGKETKAASVDQMKKMSALEDADNLEAKSGFKLQHHTAEGNKAVWRGVAAAAAALLGARGGVKGVSPDVRKSAYSGHLKKHYAQFDKDQPPFKQDYTTDELNELHAQGLIWIPGMEPGEGAEDDASASPDSQTASPSSATEQASVEPLFEISAGTVEHLRSVVRARLQDDPRAKAFRSIAVNARLQSIKENNDARKHHGTGGQGA